MKIQRLNYTLEESGKAPKKSNYLAIFWKRYSCKHLKVPFTTRSGHYK